MNPAFDTILSDHPAQADKAATQHQTSAAMDAAQRGLDATKDAAQHATQAAKDMCQSVVARAEDTLVQSKKYVREHPGPALLGTFTFGLALGCVMGLWRYSPPTLRERFSW